MYSGVGAQALYLHRGGRFAWDVAVDAVRQRNFKGTGFRDYNTVTAIASMHYKIPFLEGVTATVRAGRFLARDRGIRTELSRTFSGPRLWGAGRAKPYFCFGHRARRLVHPYQCQ